MTDTKNVPPVRGTLESLKQIGDPTPSGWINYDTVIDNQPFKVALNSRDREKGRSVKVGMPVTIIKTKFNWMFGKETWEGATISVPQTPAGSADSSESVAPVKSEVKSVLKKYSNYDISNLARLDYEKESRDPKIEQQFYLTLAKDVYLAWLAIDPNTVDSAGELIDEIVQKGRSIVPE